LRATKAYNFYNRLTPAKLQIALTNCQTNNRFNFL
jgi:hypothetical protein